MIGPDINQLSISLNIWTWLGEEGMEKKNQVKQRI